MENAVIYARYSSHGQQEQSIEGQLRDCHAFAKSHGYLIVGEYIDRAISGRTDDRPDFQRMIADSEKHAFRYVIVWKLDRFARNRYDSAFYKTKLKKQGVKVVSATENISDEPEGIILEGLLESMAEYYSANLSKHVRRGQRENILAGKFLGGKPPYGYRAVNQHLVIDERTAPAARQIFQMYADGYKKADIIRFLAENGFCQHNGKPFSQDGILRILRNKKYIGICEFDGEIYEDWCPALIERSLFDRVQRLLDKRRKAPAASRAEEPYLLQGKIFCGHCGTPMIGESGKSKNTEIYRYYSCRKRKKDHACKKHNERKESVEQYVVQQTLYYVLQEDRLNYIADAIVAQFCRDANTHKLEDLHNQINRIDTEISRLVDTLAVCPDAARNPIFDKIETLSAQKNLAENDISTLQIMSKQHYTKGEVMSWLKQFCNGDPSDRAFCERIIDTFIHCVYLYDDKTVVFYNTRDGARPCAFDPLSLPQSDSVRSAQTAVCQAKYCSNIFFDEGVFGVVFPRICRLV